ncbi:uncharacterized protein LOC113465158 [Ceratina calcarata]|uniref:Uncharacterized protein LOC113465146 n=1 Tax=Ceratina calcarata TaxID=156304 RepID=A0AAJ7WG07_9HYME|nr:uncharacterized protein LOC113465146 [Ceratina calcarata]XP_026674943.1 uncharacterized protein LOC113465158 [Ceratina calcarata]
MCYELYRCKTQEIPPIYMQPGFLSFFKKNGGILLDCDSEITVRWMKVAIKFVKLTTGCALQVEEKQALDNRFLVEGRATHSRFTGRNIVEEQRFNAGLDTSRWRVIREKQTRSGLIITLEMEGRSVGTLRKRRNRLSLDQDGVHKFNILTVSPAKNTRRSREPEEIDITEDDFLADLGGDAVVDNPLVEEVVDTAGSELNDTTTIEEVPSQRNEEPPFDASGDEFILSANLEGFEEMEIGLAQETVRVVKEGRARGSSTPFRCRAKVEDGFAYGKEKVKGKAAAAARKGTDNEDDSGVASADKDSSGSSSTLLVSLPLEETTGMTEAAPAVVRQLMTKPLAKREGHKGGHNRSKSERSAMK